MPELRDELLTAEDQPHPGRRPISARSRLDLGSVSLQETRHLAAAVDEAYAERAAVEALASGGSRMRVSSRSAGRWVEG